MEEVIGQWLSQYGLGGIIILLISVFIWRGAWPFYTKTLWPASNERANKTVDATEAIKESTFVIRGSILGIEKSIEALETLQHSVDIRLQQLNTRMETVEQKVETVESKVNHIEKSIQIYHKEESNGTTNSR